MMTKKDYERAAGIIRRMAENVPSHCIRPLQEGESTRSKGMHCEGIVIWTARESFVNLFAGDNPRFDADRFRAACVPKWALSI